MERETTRPLTIAVADDSELIRRKLAQKIQKLQATEIVWEAGDAFGAIKQFENSKPDILIVDLQMPGMSGIEMLKEINAKANKLTIFIVLTNYPLPLLKRKSEEAGADYFFDKTTEFDQVIEIIKSAKLDQSKREVISDNSYKE